MAPKKENPFAFGSSFVKIISSQYKPSLCKGKKTFAIFFYYRPKATVVYFEYNPKSCKPFQSLCTVYFNTHL